MPISISTSNYIETKEAEIDGHLFKVRKLGAGQSLDMSRMSQEMLKLQSELMNAKSRIDRAEDEETKHKETAKAMAIVDNIAVQTGKLEALFAKCFDDGEDGKRSLELVHSIGVDNTKKIIDKVFGEVNG